MWIPEYELTVVGDVKMKREEMVGDMKKKREETTTAGSLPFIGKHLPLGLTSYY
jgi:hypothetical protein